MEQITTDHQPPNPLQRIASYAAALQAEDLITVQRHAAYQLQNLSMQAIITVVAIEELQRRKAPVSPQLKAFMSAMKMFGASEGNMGISLPIGSLNLAAHIANVLGDKPEQITKADSGEHTSRNAPNTLAEKRVEAAIAEAADTSNVVNIFANKKKLH